MNVAFDRSDIFATTIARELAAKRDILSLCLSETTRGRVTARSEGREMFLLKSKVYKAPCTLSRLACTCDIANA